MRAFLASTALAGVLLSGVALAHDTEPGESPSFAFFPRHREVQATLDGYADHPWVTLHEVGESGEGRTLRLAEVTNPESPIPRSERVVTFLFTQQHGNEPAGTPAALDLLEDVLQGSGIASTLDNQVLLLLPMANPDGAAREQRGNAEGVDVNRDHAALETPEARALHAVLNRYDVHVALDHHEYGGVGPGVPGASTLYDFDLTALYPVHGNVREPTREAAEALLYEGIWPAAKEKGYSVNEYGEWEAAGVHVQQVAGGPDPGIMRNHLGLHHVTGLLIETRVDGHPNPFHDAKRRADIHRTVMDAALRYAHGHAAELIQAKEASIRAALEDPAARYVEGDRSGPLADAYAERRGLDEEMVLHGMPEGVEVPDLGLVHDLRHALRGHAAALLNPESSRALVTNAEAVDPVKLASAAASDPERGLAVPFLLAPALAGLLSCVAVLRRRT